MSAEQDSVLLENAKQRAQKLLEDYVNNIGNSIGKSYKIHWTMGEDNDAPASGDSQADQNTDGQ